MKVLRWSWVMAALVRSGKLRLAAGRKSFASPRGRDGSRLRKEGERLGAVMNMGRARSSPSSPGARGERRRRARAPVVIPSRMRGLQIMRQVVEHGGLARHDGIGADEALVKPRASASGGGSRAHEYRKCRRTGRLCRAARPRLPPPARLRLVAWSWLAASGPSG